MKFDLAIAIRIGSPRSTLSLVHDTFESITTNIGDCNYKFLISLDPMIRPEIRHYVLRLHLQYPKRFVILEEKRTYWADFINEAITRSQDCEYFIKAHDDIKLLTPNFFPRTRDYLASLKEQIGWINFTEANYLYTDYYYGPPTRPGFHLDFYQGAYERRQMFQFHNLPNNWWKGSVFDSVPPLLGILPRPTAKEIIDRIDMPLAAVKCHAPYNMMVMIKTKVLKKIGRCAKWQTYNALLVDEDWGLRAMQMRYWNIWIPQVYYLHLRPPGLRYGNRSQYQVLQDTKRVHAAFTKKWGFDTPTPRKTLQMIAKNFKSTYIPWSIDRLSYDWDYVQ